MESGTRLGPYEILEQLGAGGMGEVYLAQDNRLGRKVAIKVLPAEFAFDPERLARFEQEARAAAALNHPHIAVVHDVGAENGDDGKPIHFMVQEHLQGESLKERIVKGALPLDKALELAIEVAEALTAAHGAGIVHRDLKPDNIFVSASGHAKVLDFGLAKLVEGIGAAGTGLSLSPTVLGTVAGQIMGTAGYLAPEQINGEVDIDQRADLFACGCVLYEMMAGARAFGGETVLDTLHAITRTEPKSLAELAPQLPTELQRILKKCLAKDRDRRYQAADDVVVDLRQLRDDVAAGIAPSASTSATGVGAVTVGWSTAALLATAVAAAALATAASWVASRPAPERPTRLVDFALPLPEDVSFTSSNRQSVAFSPDGSRVVFVANRQLWTRRLDETEIAPLRGTYDDGRRVEMPMFSSDAQHVAFLTGEDIRRVEVGGGVAQVLTALPDGYRHLGASWADDGNLYIALRRGGEEGGIWRVPENGGELQSVVTVEAGYPMSPQLLPAGEWLLFTLPKPDGTVLTMVQSLITDEQRELFAGGTDARYLPTGHIVYARDSTLLARTFDPATLDVGTEAAPVREEVSPSSGIAHWAFSSRGDLVYRPGQGGGSSRSGLTWYTADGKTERVELPPVDGSLNGPRMSPTGEHIAVELRTGDASRIVTYDVDQKNLQQFAPSGQAPQWAPDGEWLYYSDDNGGNQDIYRGRVASSVAPEVFLVRDGDQAVSDVTANRLLFNELVDGVANVWVLALEAGAEPELVVRVPAGNPRAVFSPDGDWVAYGANETGTFEVWAQEFPGPGRKVKVSGGEVASQPVWLESGIFYDAGGRWTFVQDRDPGPGFDPAPPKVLLSSTLRSPLGSRNYDVSADGLRVLAPSALVSQGDVNGDGLRIVLNWFDVVRQKLPTDR